MERKVAFLKDDVSWWLEAVKLYLEHPHSDLDLLKETQIHPMLGW